MSKREKQKHCFLVVLNVLDATACLLGNFDVGEEKRVQEGKNKAPVTMRTMPQTPVPSKLEHNFSLEVALFVLLRPRKADLNNTTKSQSCDTTTL